MVGAVSWVSLQPKMLQSHPHAGLQLCASTLPTESSSERICTFCQFPFPNGVSRHLFNSPGRVPPSDPAATSHRIVTLSIRVIYCSLELTSSMCGRPCQQLVVLAGGKVRGRASERDP